MAVPLCPSARAQFWDKLTKPKITVNLTHPPKLGLNLKKLALGPPNGACADEIADGLSSALVSQGVEVVDRQNLQAILDEHRFNLSSYVDSASAVELGKLLGPSALVFVKVTRCKAEQKKTYKDYKTTKGELIRHHFSTTTMHIRGTFQTVDLATGKIFVASPLTADREITNNSDEGWPEFPSEDLVRDQAIKGAVFEAAAFLVPWREQKALYFFDDKECNLNQAFSAMKANDIPGALERSEQNLSTCKDAPKLKGNTLAHAYYNAGLANLLVNQYAKAMSYLQESEKLRGGEIVTQTIAEANRSAMLAVEMQRVEQRTANFEQAQSAAKIREAAAPGISPDKSRAPAEPIEERLKKLDALFKKGLISKEEFESKKAEILRQI
jgi:tetratricopeptide (TPR) repeat protein